MRPSGANREASLSPTPILTSALLLPRTLAPLQALQRITTHLIYAVHIVQRNASTFSPRGPALVHRHGMSTSNVVILLVALHPSPSRALLARTLSLVYPHVLLYSMRDTQTLERATTHFPTRALAAEGAHIKNKESTNSPLTNAPHLRPERSSTVGSSAPASACTLACCKRRAGQRLCAGGVLVSVHGAGVVLSVTHPISADFYSHVLFSRALSAFRALLLRLNCPCTPTCNSHASNVV